jgi:1-pyrroline-5-carboxylate dehydrogenase
MEPTAVTVPLSTMLSSQENFEVVTTELFGPFQVLVPYKDDEIDDVSRALPILDSVQTD